jgi:hypothetical protein
MLPMLGRKLIRVGVAVPSQQSLSLIVWTSNSERKLVRTP